MSGLIKIFSRLEFIFLSSFITLYAQDHQIIIKDFQVNENAGWTDHYDPQIAVKADGSFVIAWHDYKNTHADIYIQRFDSSINRIGPDILVNDDAGVYDQVNPDIGMDNRGNFVLVWMDGRSGRNEIYAQLFDYLANPSGPNFRINEDPGQITQYSYPSVAMSGEGNFVIAWQENQDSISSIYVRIYNKMGEALSNIIKVNEQTNNVDQYARPDAGMDNDGNFIIVWEKVRQNTYRDIFAQCFDKNGNKQQGNFKVNDDNNDRFHGDPSIGVFPNGSFIISWIDERNYFYDIYAQRFDYNRFPIAGNFIVNDVEFGQQFNPIVTTSSSGRFLITWKDQREEANLSDIFTQVYNKDGTTAGSNIKIRDDNNSMYYLTPACAGMDSAGNFIIGWNERSTGNYQIYLEKFDPDGNLTKPLLLVNNDEGSGNQINPVICAVNNGKFYTAWEDYRNGNADIYIQGYTAEGAPISKNYLVNDNKDKSEQSHPRMGIDSSGNLFVVWLDYREGINNVYGQRYNSGLKPFGGNFRINENSPESGAWFPKIAMNKQGNCVVTWLESSWPNIDIYSQRFDSNGNKQGNNFKIDDDPVNIPILHFLYEDEFAVGIDDSNNFIISWAEFRENNFGVFFKIFNSDGSPAKDITRAKIDDSLYINNHSMKMNANGYFIISWVDQENDNLYAQLYKPGGNPAGSNILINDKPGSIYGNSSPALCIDEYLNWCIAWQDMRNGSYDIYGQAFSNDRKIGSNFIINSNSGINNQVNPDLILINYKLYTTWEDNRIPRHGWDVFANVINLNELTSISSPNHTNTEYYLFQNYPNPFNPATRINYSIPLSGYVTLKIYNLLGEVVAILVDGTQQAGTYSINFNADKLASGVYIYQLKANNFVQAKKLVLLK